MNQPTQPPLDARLYKVPALPWRPPALWSVLWRWGLATGIGIIPALIPAMVGIVLLVRANSDTAAIIIALITAAAMASPIALLQRLVLATFSETNGWWARATIGGAIAGVGLLMLDQRFDVSSMLLWFAFGDDFDTAHTWLAVPFGLIGLAVGFFQWLVLRRAAHRAGWWIAANLIAGLLIGWIGEMRGDEFTLGILQLLAYALITGIALRLLLGQPRFEAD